MTIEFEMKRSEDQPKNYVKFEIAEEDMPYKFWKNGDRRRYIPKDSPLASAAVIKVTLEVTEEYEGED